MCRGPEISCEVRYEVLERDSYTCQYCGANGDDVVLHVDHIIPKCLGGTNNIFNLVTACATCNLSKGGRMPTKKHIEALDNNWEHGKMIIDLSERIKKSKQRVIDIQIKEIEDVLLCNFVGSNREVLKRLLLKYKFQVILNTIEIHAMEKLISDGEGYFTPDSLFKTVEDTIYSLKKKEVCVA